MACRALDVKSTKLRAAASHDQRNEIENPKTNHYAAKVTRYSTHTQNFDGLNMCLQMQSQYVASQN